MKNLFVYAIIVISLSKCNSQSVDKIVLVNVGNLDRGAIAHEISILNALNPRVVAIDLQFRELKEPEADAKLTSALWNCKNLVMTSAIHNLANEKFIGLNNHSQFSPPQVKSGFINAILEEDKNRSLKRFLIQDIETVGAKRVEYHFGIKTAMAYDSLKTLKFIASHSKTADVDYKKGRRAFRKVSAEEVLNGKLTENDIAGKIVLIGFLGPGTEDKFYTPLNKGQNSPDMYGLYLANITAQVLEFDSKE
jgi:CHASE2 domain-containing sensor protein